MGWPRNGWAKITLGLVALTLVVGLGGAAYVVRWQQQPFGAQAHPPEPVVVTLARGEPFARFAERLHEHGVLPYPRLWTLLARVGGEARRVQAGEYRVDPADSPATLLQRLVRGDVVRYHVQLLEGWTAMQAVAALAGHPTLERQLDGVSVHTLLAVLGLPDGHAEGLFYPDTYQFVRGDSDADILRRAYRRMDQVLTRAWADRAPELPYRTPYEALIVASLIEKETGRDSDRPFVSQVFARRLEIGMRLQTDPSVIYGLGDAFDGNLRRVHLRADTPYNTYTRHGLPPTPIALPGERSILAALHPEPGEYLYFVSRGDGTSQFSLNLEQHVQAVRRYQLLLDASGEEDR